MPFANESPRLIRTTSGLKLCALARPLASSALALVIEAGARDEQPSEEGLAHALEHMLFKGTDAMDAGPIAEEIDMLGGRIDAWTSRERIVLHAHVASEDTERALSLLLALAFSPRFPEAEWRREREVILAEIAMSEDDPFDWGYERHLMHAFAGDPFGRSVLGSPSSLKKAGVHQLSALHRRWFVQQRIALVAAGGIDLQALCQQCNALSSIPEGEAAHHPMPSFSAGLRCFARDMEQLIIFVSMVEPRHPQQEPPVRELVHQTLGGGTSSALFRELRDAKGLAYSVSASLDRFDAFTLSTIEIACAPERAKEAAFCLHRLLQGFPRMLDEKMLMLAKRQRIIGLSLALDQPPALAEMIAQRVLVPTQSIKALMDATNAVELADARRYAQRLVALPAAISFVGPKAAVAEARRAWLAAG